MVVAAGIGYTLSPGGCFSACHECGFFMVRKRDLCLLDSALGWSSRTPLLVLDLFSATCSCSSSVLNPDGWLVPHHIRLHIFVHQVFGDLLHYWFGNDLVLAQIFLAFVWQNCHNWVGSLIFCCTATISFLIFCNVKYSRSASTQ